MTKLWKIYHLGLNLVLYFILVSCMGPDPVEKFVTFDFIDTGLFTAGIEGPAFDQDGNLYVVNFSRQGTIGRIDQKSKTGLFLDLPDGSTGNGICFDRNEEMFVADYTGHNILKISLKEGTVSLFAHEPLMNQPNDLCIKNDGTIFASDPNWKNGTGKLWKIDNSGRSTCLDSLMGTTNGIALSPDEKKLYVNESVQRKIWVFDLGSDNRVINKNQFHQFKDYGLDGMRCDREGRLFVTRFGKGTVVIISPEGELIEEISLKGKNPTNLAIKDNFCFITEASRKCIEVFRFK